MVVEDGTARGFKNFMDRIYGFDRLTKTSSSVMPHSMPGIMGFLTVATETNAA